jgi:hypothetical protein
MPEQGDQAIDIDFSQERDIVQTIVGRLGKLAADFGPFFATESPNEVQDAYAMMPLLVRS